MTFDLAFSLDEITRTAMAIKFSEFHGKRFNLSTMSFEDPA